MRRTFQKPQRISWQRTLWKRASKLALRLELLNAVVALEVPQRAEDLALEVLAVLVVFPVRLVVDLANALVFSPVDEAELPRAEDTVFDRPDGPAVGVFSRLGRPHPVAYVA